MTSPPSDIVGTPLVSVSAISAAQRRIADRIRHTPLLEINFPGATATTLVKLDNLQLTGSFKLRVELNALTDIVERGSTGVITYSASSQLYRAEPR